MQNTKSKNKLYVLHASRFDCTSKSSTGNEHEFSIQIFKFIKLEEFIVEKVDYMRGNSWDEDRPKKVVRPRDMSTYRQPNVVIVHESITKSLNAQVAPLSIDLAGAMRQEMIKTRFVIEATLERVTMRVKLRRESVEKALADALNTVRYKSAQTVWCLFKKGRLFLNYISAAASDMVC